MAAGLLLEHFYASGVTLGDIGADRNRSRMETRYRLHIAGRDLAGGRRDHRRDVFGPADHRRTAAEHRLAGAPRRQAVNLRAHDAVEKIRGARRQFERTQQEALWL